MLRCSITPRFVHCNKYLLQCSIFCVAHEDGRLILGARPKLVWKMGLP